MTSDNIERLRILQARLVDDAASVTTRADYLRLRAYYGDISEILTAELDTDGKTE